ncbi:T9SS type B sorting domain-containing protein [Tenacibaculum sp. 190524A02b]|uniref:T9SS type B sorting domain-containing protein n=1 Tax=Tenacibaculum vairaonense TaxID=3137860 RepID=UPI0031FA4F3C
MKTPYFVLVVLFAITNLFAQNEPCNETQKPTDEAPITLQQLSNLITTPSFYDTNHRYLDGLGTKGGKYSGGFFDTWLGETQIMFPYNGLPIVVNKTSTQYVANDSNYMYWMALTMGQEYMNVDMQWMMGIGAKETFSGTVNASATSLTNGEGAFGPFEVEMFTGLDRVMAYPSFFPKYELHLTNARDIATSGVDPTDFMANYVGTTADIAWLNEAPAVNGYMLGIMNFFTIYNWFSYAQDLCWQQIIEEPADPYYALASMTVTYNRGFSAAATIAETMKKDNYEATKNNPNARDLLPTGHADYRKHITEVIESIVARGEQAATNTSTPLWDYEITWEIIERFFLGEGGTIDVQGKGGLLRHYAPKDIVKRQDIMGTLQQAFTILKGKAPSSSANTISFRYDWLALLRTVKQHFPNDKIFEKPTGGDTAQQVENYSQVGGCCYQEPEIEIIPNCQYEPTSVEVLTPIEKVEWVAKFINEDGDIETFGVLTNKKGAFFFPEPREYTIDVKVTVDGIETVFPQTTVTIPVRPIANEVEDYSSCTDIFDLTTKDAEVIGVQVIPNIKVDYYPVEEHAMLGGIPIQNPTAYTFDGDTKEIFARIYVEGSQCYAVTSFKLSKSGTTGTLPIEDNYAFCGSSANATDKEVRITLDSYDTYSWNKIATNGDATEFFTGNEVVITEEGNYSVTVTSGGQGGCELSKDFTVEVISPTANKPSDFNECSVNGQDIVFDLTTKTAEILGSQQGAEVTFHTSQADADAGTEIIQTPDSYSITTDEKEIFARVFIQGKTCQSTTSFMLRKNEITINLEEEYAFCNNSTDPNDSQVKLSLEVFDSYSWNTLGANGIKTEFSTAREVTITNAGTYSVTVRKGVCEETKEFKVDGVDPIANQPSEYSLCIKDGEDPIFDLTTKDVEIINGQVGNFTITYHNTEDEANSGTAPITNTTNYTFSETEKEIYARIFIADKGCHNSTSFKLIKNDLSINVEEEYNICSGTISTVEIDLSNDGFDSYEWRYLDTSEDISTEPKVTLTKPGTYSIKVTKNNLCEAIKTFKITKGTSVNNVTTNYIICDTGNDIVFDLSTKEEEIRQSVLGTSLEISFHLTQENADTNTEPITNITNYSFDGNSQEVFARFAETGTECYSVSTFTLYKNNVNPKIEESYAICNSSANVADTQILLSVGVFDTYSWMNVDKGKEVSNTADITITETGNYSLTITNTIDGETCSQTKNFVVTGVDPIATPLSNYIMCVETEDEPIFDLTTKTSEVIGTQQGTNLAVTYHTNLADAQSGTEAIQNPSEYTFQGSETEIFVRLYLEDKGCQNTTSFWLKKNTIFIPLEDDYAVCNNSANVADTQIQLTLGTFSTYSWRNEDDNTEESTTADFIATKAGNYSVTITNTIDGETCSQTKAFTVTGVDPIANKPEDYVLCVDDTTTTPVFDLTTKTTEVIGNQTGANLIVTYHTSQIGAESGDSSIPHPSNHSFTGEETEVFARIYIDGRGCQNTTSFKLVKNDITIAIEDRYILCTGNEDNDSIDLQVDNTNFDTFKWVNTDTNTIVSNTANATINTTGTYSIIATNTNSTCNEATKTFRVVAADIGTINITSQVENNDTIIVEVTGITDTFTYALDDLNGNYQNQVVFENVAAGEHTVYVKTSNGCIYSTRVIVDEDIVIEPEKEINIPKFFTPNGDGINPTWFITDPTNSIPENTKIYIYNRFGKLVTTIVYGGNGWDGTHNGQKMPSNDYWYSFQFVKDNETQSYKGHFSLLRSEVR